MQTERAFELSEHEQESLIRAIESAIEVSQQDHFHAWIRGPFRTLLPHESLVCMEIDGRGEVCRIECLQHNLAEAATMDFLCHPEHGLAVRLALLFRGKPQICNTVDANAIAVLRGADDRSGPQNPWPLHNAVVHRTKFLSGADYFFVLFNVPQDRVDRCQRLFKLLSSHLKMALWGAVAPEGRRSPAPLTERELEILRWMREGKSNREISAILGINAMTLKSHISKLYRKLDVQSRAEAVARAKLA